MDRRLRGPSTLRTLVVGVVVFFVAACVTYQVALWVHPTLVNGRRVMALGHAIIAIGVGAIAAIVAMVGDYLWQRRR